MTSVFSLSDGVHLRACDKGRILPGLAQRGLAGIVLFNPINTGMPVMPAPPSFWHPRRLDPLAPTFD